MGEAVATGGETLSRKPHDEADRPAVFLSCLGTTNYRELEYAPHDGEGPDVKTTRTRFIQLARLKALQKRGIPLKKAYILVTQDARRKNWDDFAHPSPAPGALAGTPQAPLTPGLKSSLETEGLSAEPVDIPDGKSFQQFWEIFQKVGECIPRDADLYVDLTHGFRTLPVLVLLALEYLEKAKGARTRELTYGADQAQENGVAPTWNLKPFLEVREWATALSLFLEYGDTRPLAEFLEHGDTRPVAKKPEGPVRQLARELRQKTPPALRKLPAAFEAFGASVVHCHAPSIPETASRLRKVTGQAIDECRSYPRFAPLGIILERVQQALCDFPDEPSGPVDRLRAQIAAARWCLNHRLVMQAFTFLREACVSALAELAGQSQRPRGEQDDLLGALLAQGKAFSPRTAQWVRQQVKAWHAHPPVDLSLWGQLKKDMSSLVGIRNDLNHAYTKEPRKELSSEDTYRRLGESILRSLKALIEVIEANPSPGPPKEIGQAPRQMLVLLSHDLTPEQEADARQNWNACEILKAPESLQGRWSHIDPEGELPQDLRAEIQSWLDQTGRPGDLLLVQGEPGMTWLAVQDARERGLVPVYATTRREVSEELLPEGFTKKTSLFRHVQFREYPAGDGPSERHDS